MIKRDEKLILCTKYYYIRVFVLVIINATLFLSLWIMKGVFLFQKSNHLNIFWTFEYIFFLKVTYARHTIKPGTAEQGTAEHGTPAEERNTPEKWRNNWTLPGTPAEHPRIPKEYQRNTSGTPPEQWSHTKRRIIVVFLRENLNLKTSRLKYFLLLI